LVLSFGTVVGSRSDGGKQDFARYWENSIVIPGPDMDRLSRFCILIPKGNFLVNTEN